MQRPSSTASTGCAAAGRLPSGWPTLVSGGIADLKLPSQSQPFRLSLPHTYSHGTPRPLLLYFHGWGGSLDEALPFHDHGRAQGYIVASPLGHSDGGARLPSWNGAGTADGPSPAGRTCVDPGNAFKSNCYTSSCKHCNNSCWSAPPAQLARMPEPTPAMCPATPNEHLRGPTCEYRWTTCEDSVEQVATARHCTPLPSRQPLPSRRPLV